MTLVINAAQAEAVLEMPALVAALERAFQEEVRGGVVLPPRLNLSANDVFFRMMPAIMSESGLMGFKAFHGSTASGARYLVAVYDAHEGELLALLDGHFLTAARTGATAGVAARYMAKPDARRVAVIGSGLEARTNLAAVCAVRDIDEVVVFSPRPERRELFAQEAAAELGVRATPASSAEACVAGADIVVVATNTRHAADPIAFRGAWFEPGMHVSSIGSTSARGREIDPDTFARAEGYVSDAPDQARDESGDVLAAREAGVYRDAVALASVVAGAGGRTTPDQRTLFKSVGTAVQDVVAGFLVYEGARDAGLGVDIGDFLDRKSI